MNCVKIGAQIYIEELGAVFAADIYSVGPDVLVVRFNGKSERWTTMEEAEALGATHFAHQPTVPTGDWCREDLGVLVIHRAYVRGELVE
jgi:hypothetical protein